MNHEMRFRKRPVEVNAVQYTRRFAWPDWFCDAVSDKKIITYNTGKFSAPGVDCFCTIQTPEGLMRANEGDWIIQGVQGEIYPCKPDIFECTYEQVIEARSA